MSPIQLTGNTRNLRLQVVAPLRADAVAPPRSDPLRPLMKLDFIFSFTVFPCPSGRPLAWSHSPYLRSPVRETNGRDFQRVEQCSSTLSLSRVLLIGQPWRAARCRGANPAMINIQCHLAHSGPTFLVSTPRWGCLSVLTYLVFGTRLSG